MGKHSLSDTHTNNFIEFKNRLSKSRKGIGMTQEKVCESINLSSRSTLSNFESKKMERLPSLNEFVDLCDLYNVDPNYLLGFDEVRNFTVKTCCDELKLNENAVITIMKNKMASILVNELFSGDSYAEIEQYITWLNYYNKLRDVITTAFTSSFISRLELLFSRYYTSTFPLDYSENTFIRFLKSEEIFKKYKDIYEFMDKCFLTEARNNLTFSYPDFDNLNEAEQHDAVLSIIALHSYAYLMSRVHFEDVERRLMEQLAGVIRRVSHEYPFRMV